MKNKILAIDDNKFIIELIQEILSEDKYDVHSITDSTYVYDYVKNNLPDLILLDVMMPETDGFELCEILKNNDKTKHIPIIFTTALDAESDIGRGFELGAADYITKPFNFFEFKSRVDNQLKIINSEKVLRKELKYRTIIEERYRLAQQAVGIGVWEWDILKNNISLSTVSFQIFGIEETKNDEVSYIRILKAVHYLDRRKFISQIATAVKDKLKIHVSEYRIVKDKEIRIIHKTSKIQYNKEGNPIKIIGVIRDITDEKKHEVELIKLSEAVKQSANTIVFTDTDGNIEYVNPKFTEVTGYTFDEALGQNPRILKSGVQKDSVYKELWQSITKGESWAGEFHNKAKDGTLFWEKATISPIKNKEGKTISYVAIKKDITEKKEFENNLLLSQKVAKLGHFSLNLKTGNWSISGELNKILGIDTTFEEDGEKWTDLIHPDNKEEIQKYFSEKNLRKYKKFDKQFKIINQKSGKVIWVHAIGELRLENDNIAEMFGTIQDISKQKKAEQELKQTKQFAENLLETANTMVVGLGRNAEITIFNRYAENITGYSKDEVLGKNWFEIFIPEKEKNKITEIFIKTLKKMQSKSINENVILTKNKEELIIDWSNNVVRNSDNEIYGVLSIGRDITDQKKAEKALFENELNFRNIFNESNDGIIITSLKGKIIDINDRLCKMLEYEKEELLHKQVSVVRPKESRLNRDKIIERLKTKGRFVFESVNKAKSGEEIPVEISSIFIEYFGEKAILSATRDITERKQAEQKLLTAIIKTEEKERQRVAQDLHDGLGPLISTIKLYVQWAMKPNKKADKTDLLKKAEENISEAYKSLRDISNNLSPHILQNFGLISALNSYADRVKETSDIEINIDTNINKNSADIVDTVIYRVFTEAVNNTIKHAEATRIDIILNKTENIIKAEYFDNGTGFDVDSVLKSKKGQGLYNTQNRLKSIGGKLQIKSRKGEGTLIEIEIDLSKLKQLN